MVQRVDFHRLAIWIRWTGRDLYIAMILWLWNDMIMATMFSDSIVFELCYCSYFTIQLAFYNILGTTSSKIPFLRYLKSNIASNNYFQSRKVGWCGIAYLVLSLSWFHYSFATDHLFFTTLIIHSISLIEHLGFLSSSKQPLANLIETRSSKAFPNEDYAFLCAFGGYSL